MAQKIRIQVLRVTSSNRASYTPAAGEFLFETDTDFLYIGDGSTAGGNLVSATSGTLVASINGEDGIVTLEALDIGRTPNATIAASDVEAALIENRGVSNTNASNLTTEITDRTNADATLQTQIDSNDTDITAIQADITQLQADVASPSLRVWTVNGGFSNFPATGTEQISWGNSAGNDGWVAYKDCRIVGMSCCVNPVGTAGSASFRPEINGTQVNVAGQRIILDGNVGVEGESTSREGGFIDMSGSPIDITAGDKVHMVVVTSGWAPTSSDGSVILWLEER